MMREKFIVYAVVVAFVCTIFSWRKMLEPSTATGGGSSWSSSSGSYGGSSGGHK